MASESESTKKNPVTPNTKGKSEIQTDQRSANVLATADVFTPPPTEPQHQITYKTEKSLWDKVKDGAEILGICILAIYTCYTIKMYHANKEAADAARDSANISRDYLSASQRPWVKIKHRIVKPLTFNSPAWKGPVASMIAEDTIENVGTSVALNVISWEDVIPVDSDLTLHTAIARQNQWCDANRHPDPKSLSGYVLFPKDPFVQNSSIGPAMDVVTKAAQEIPGGMNELKGKVSFVLVGCVCYRSPVDPKHAPLHETRFVYRLGEIQANGTMQPFVQPSGVAAKLSLIEFPDGFSAD